MSDGDGNVLDDQRLKLWRASFAEGATDVEFMTFVELVRQTGLSPEARQIYLRKQWDNNKSRNTYTPLTGIDGYRLVADRTGKYAGNDDPIFDDEQSPTRATVTVYKLVGGIRCPFTASARWDQYYPGDKQGFMWKKMKHLMLGKCAEALALRKAFPAELSGLYTQEEMEQAGVEPEPPKSQESATQGTSAPCDTGKPPKPQQTPEQSAFNSWAGPLVKAGTLSREEVAAVLKSCNGNYIAAKAKIEEAMAAAVE